MAAPKPMATVQVKGECPICHKSVLDNENRTKNAEGSYLHQACSEKQKAVKTTGIPANLQEGSNELTLYVGIISGTNLLGLHSSGTSSDPFVDIYVNTPNFRTATSLDRTRTVKKDLNPEFDYASKFKIDKRQYDDGMHLVLRIFDDHVNLLGMRTLNPMGQVSIPLQDIADYEKTDSYAVVASGHPEVTPVRGNGEKRFKGHLRISLRLSGLPRKPPVVISYRAPPPALESVTAISSIRHDGQALESSELAALAKILDIAGQLTDLGVRIDAPQVAVIGGQSAGKSTLFNVVLKEVGSYARFPTGSGTCTKCPTMLQLVRSAESYVEVDNEIVRPATTAAVMDAIRAAQTRVLKRTFPNYKETDVVFSSTPVRVKASSPKIATEIVIVDLPGMVASTLEGSDTVKNMIKQTIESENTLIVAAAKSDNDDANDEGIGMAKRVDPSGSRTLRAYTFWPPRDVRKDEILAAISGARDSRFRPHVIELKNNGTGEMVPATAHGVPREFQGTSMLVQRLSLRLGALVRDTAGQLQMKFENELKRIENEISKLGEVLNEEKVKDAKMRVVFLCVDKVKEKALAGYELTQSLDNLMKKFTETSGVTIPESKINYWGKSDTELSLFQGRDKCKEMVEEHVQGWRMPFTEFIAEVDIFLGEMGEKYLAGIKKEEDDGRLPKGFYDRVMSGEYHTSWNKARQLVIDDITQEFVMDSTSKGTLDTLLNIAIERPMTREEMNDYLNPDPMVVLNEYIEMSKDPECKDLCDDDKSVLSYLLERHFCKPYVEGDENNLIGCAKSRQPLGEGAQGSDRKDGVVVLDDHLAYILAVRRRIKNGVKEWIGYMYRGENGEHVRPCGILGAVKDQVKQKVQAAIKYRVVENFGDGIGKFREFLTDDTDKSVREKLKKQRRLVERALDEVSGLTSQTA